MTQRKKFIGICCFLGVLVLLVFVALYQKKEKKQEPISSTAFKLNTVVTLTLYDSTDEELLQEAMDLCDDYEQLFSRTLETSELYQLNHGTLPNQEHAYTISSDTAELISKGLEYGELSKGAFDITIGPVSSLWDFTSEQKKVPKKEELDAALPLVNYQDVQISQEQVTFAKEGMMLDLGAIAKGYIADKIKEFLLEHEVKSATINLGGNVLCVGEKPDGMPFRIGIQKPFADRSETIAVMDIADKSVVSSGIYERYFEQDGTFYHHILNPATGMPYDNHLVSVTIISDKSVDGDGLSTSCFALGLEKGMELVNSLPDVQAVFITDDYQMHYSDGFEEEIKMNSVEK